MLPIAKAVITYPDQSTYTIPDDGTWAEAPPFGVECVVYYLVSEPDKLQTQTVDGGEENGDIYIWLGENSHPDYAGHKMGMWMDHDGYYRIYDLARRRVSPEV